MSPRSILIRQHLEDRYNSLWSAALPKIHANTLDLDPLLAKRAPDHRRGLTLIARPDPQTRRRITTFLRQLRQLEPDQHYYPSADLHLTILSLFTATTDHRKFFTHAGQYISAVNIALEKVPPLQIKFHGLTASPGALMLQGFFTTDALNHLRDKLRHQLHTYEVGQGVDGRYRLETAHLTIARFRAPLRDSHRFATFLEKNRHHAFGTLTPKTLTLVKNDWYMSHQTLQILKRYRLSQSS